MKRYCLQDVKLTEEKYVMSDFLLKKPPLSFKNKEVKRIYDLLVDNHEYGDKNYTQDLEPVINCWSEKKRNSQIEALPGCCAIHVLTSLPFCPNTAYSFKYNASKANLEKIQPLTREMESAYVYFLCSHRLTEFSTYPYIIVILNSQEIKQGYKKIFEKYFGFKQLEQGFANPGHGSQSKIVILGRLNERISQYV